MKRFDTSMGRDLAWYSTRASFAALSRRLRFSLLM